MWQDLRYAVRSLGRRRGTTAAALLSFALGIGANAAIFSIVHAVLLRPLPYVHPDRLVIVRTTNPQDPNNTGVASYDDFADWRRQSRAFAEMGLYWSWTMTMTAPGDPEAIDGGIVTAGFFRALGVQAGLGRMFSDEDEQPGRAAPAILSHGFWQRRFGGRSDVVGTPITLDGRAYVIAGVLPVGFRFPIAVGNAELWLPMIVEPSGPMNRASRMFHVLGRLEPSRSRANAQAEMDEIAARLAQEYPTSNRDRGVALVPLRDAIIQDTRTALFLVAGAVLAVLLLTCANVGALMLAGAVARQRDVALRLALGAPRGRSVRQFACESVLLALAGGLIGLVVARGLIQLIPRIAGHALPGIFEVRLDWTVLFATLAIAAFGGLLAAIVPIGVVRTADTERHLRDGARTGSRTRGAVGKALVVSESAAALVLLIAAGLMVQSYARLVGVDSGFDSRDVLTMQVALPFEVYGAGPRTAAIFDQITERLRALPGVVGAAAVNRVPFGGGNHRIRLTGGGQPTGSERMIDYRTITPAYFDVMRIPVRRGRAFDRRDHATAAPVAIINEKAARLYWPGEDPLGKRLSVSLRLGPNEPREREIVGIVGDVLHDSLAATPSPEVYLPHFQHPWFAMMLVVRSPEVVEQIAGAARREVLAVAADQPPRDVRTLESRQWGSAAAARLHAWLFGGFAFLGLALAVTGLYAVVADVTERRIPEIGVRIACGATPRRCVRVIVGDALRLVAAGVALGLTAAFLVTRLFSAHLFGTTALDVSTYLIAACVISAAALAGAWIPARRATLVNPAVALRSE
jgi:predicted permease